MNNILKTGLAALICFSTLQAGEFNTQAEIDRKAMIKYMEAKFADPDKNREYFPYSTDDELKNGFKKGLKHQDFSKGNYAFNKNGSMQHEAMMEFPPFEDNIENGEEIWNKKFANGKSFSDCFGEPTNLSVYPQYVEDRGRVVTLTMALNECLVDNGEKKLNTKKGAMADLQAYIAYQFQENELVIDTKINSAGAAKAYEDGKKYYYTQRGYLKLNCAQCHVQGAGKRVRNENLSQALGHVSHFPVYRLKWQGLGTLERRVSGCVKDQGQVPPSDTSKDMANLIYYMSYISNGMKYDGPDLRK